MYIAFIPSRITVERHIMKFLSIEKHVISNCPIIDHIQIILQVVTILDISYFTVDSSVIGKTNELCR